MIHRCDSIICLGRVKRCDDENVTQAKACRTSALVTWQREGRIFEARDSFQTNGIRKRHQLKADVYWYLPGFRGETVSIWIMTWTASTTGLDILMWIGVERCYLSTRKSWNLTKKTATCLNNRRVTSCLGGWQLLCRCTHSKVPTWTWIEGKEGRLDDDDEDEDEDNVDDVTDFSFSTTRGKPPEALAPLHLTLKSFWPWLDSLESMARLHLC